MSSRPVRAARLLGLVLLILLSLQIAPTRAAAADPPKGGKEAEAIPNQLLVGFEAGAFEGARDAALATVGGRTLRVHESINARLIELPGGQPTASAIGALKANGSVRYSEPNIIYHAIATPNDPQYAPNLWGLNNTGQSIPAYGGGNRTGTPGADIKASAAWDLTTGSRSIVVGVVDTGIDFTHPDLAPNLWSAPAGFTVGPPGGAACPGGSHGLRAGGAGATINCTPQDDNNHGSHVSGTIGGNGNDGVGVVGVNWQVSLMGLKFLESNGSSATSDAITVIDFAVRAKQAGVNLRVLSNSWGCLGASCFSQALLDEINVTSANGILFVAAVGNSNSNNDVTPNYPSNYNTPNMVAVAATNNVDGLSAFSQYGANTVHLGAPGEGVYSTICATSSPASGCTHDYAFFNGTSMATPHVAGAAALVLSAPGLGALTVAQLKTRLLTCGDVVPSLAGKTSTGRRLNVYRAITNTGCATGPFTVSTSSSPPGAGTVAANPPGPTYAGGTDVTLTATPAAGYTFAGWQVNGIASGTANPLLIHVYDNQAVVAQFVQAPVNNDFPGLTIGVPYQATTTNAAATIQAGEPTTCGSATYGKTLWYTYTPPANTTITISTASSDFDTVVNVFTGSAVNSLTSVGCNDDFGDFQ